MRQEKSKPKSHESTSTEQTMLEWIEPEDGVYDVYSNLIYLNWTAFDIRIRFAQAIPKFSEPPQTARWVMEERVAVTMAWAQAKLLRDQLNEVIQRYEKINGEIVTPNGPL